MKTLITIEGDEALIRTFIAAGLRAANNQCSDPFTFQVMQEYLRGVDVDLAEGRASQIDLGAVRPPELRPRIVRGAPHIRKACEARLTKKTATAPEDTSHA